MARHTQIILVLLILIVPAAVIAGSPQSRSFANALTEKAQIELTKLAERLNHGKPQPACKNGVLVVGTCLGAEAAMIEHDYGYDEPDKWHGSLDARTTIVVDENVNSGLVYRSGARGASPDEAISNHVTDWSTYYAEPYLKAKLGLPAEHETPRYKVYGAYRTKGGLSAARHPSLSPAAFVGLIDGLLAKSPPKIPVISVGIYLNLGKGGVVGAECRLNDAVWPELEEVLRSKVTLGDASSGHVRQQLFFATK